MVVSCFWMTPEISYNIFSLIEAKSYVPFELFSGWMVLRSLFTIDTFVLCKVLLVFRSRISHRRFLLCRLSNYPLFILKQLLSIEMLIIVYKNVLIIKILIVFKIATI